MADKENINLVRQLFDEVYSKGNIDKCDQFIAENVKFHDVALNNGFRGLKGFKEAEKNYQKAFPDKKLRIEEIIAAEDKVVVYWSCKGTHRGMLQDIPPTNKPINISGIIIYQLSKGKVTEIWQSWDRLGLLEQIGEIAPAHQALHA